MAGNFTFDHGSSVDSVISEHLRVIIKRLTMYNDRLGIVSIVLAGGFGRGEGSVLIEKNKIKPLNDYDVVIVSNKRVPDYRLLNKLSQDLADELQIDFVDISAINEHKLAVLSPSIFNYELKTGSKVIWGKDVLNDILAIRSNMIPLSDAVSLLFNRMFGLILAYPKFCSNPNFMVNQSVKAILACCESFLLLHGKYHYSYRTRKDVFLKEFPCIDKEAFSEFPGLIDYVSIATEFKLSPDYSKFKDPVGLWYEVVTMYLKFFKFFMRRYLGLHTDNLDELMVKFVEEERSFSLNTWYAWGVYNYKWRSVFRTSKVRFNFFMPPRLILYASGLFLLDMLKNDEEDEVRIGQISVYLKNVIDLPKAPNQKILFEQCMAAWNLVSH